MRHISTITFGALAASALLAGCASEADTTTVTVVTHDSWAMSDDVVAAFEAETGYQLEFVAPGDAGALVNQLVLTKDSPLGDVVYGIDNTFASRALDAGVIDPYDPRGGNFVRLGSLPGLSTIDYSAVCINADIGYFDDAGLAIPETLDDLTKPEYRGLLSVTNPSTSSPGMAFLLGTVAAKGDAWPDYWAALVENDVRVTASWSDTYYSDFSAPNYGGEYPLVLSYSSSPPFEVIDGEPTTVALLETCFTQFEYAGVLTGTDNPEGARAVIDWMRSAEFQAELPTQMYVYPASLDAELPPEWASYAPAPVRAFALDADDIAQNRAEYLAEWTATVVG